MAFDPTSYPYDTVVRITDSFDGVGRQASGVLIAPDEVLTASHVVFTAGIGVASDIVVTPAYQFGAAPFGSAVGVSFHYFAINDANNQISNIDSQSDFAVIHLSTPFSATGYMGLLAGFTGGAVTIAGYPASAAGAMVSSEQTVRLDPRLSLLEDVALGPGSSGGPLFVGGASNPQVVGIVSSGSTVSDTGFNGLITQAVLNQIEQWVASDDASAATLPAPVQFQDLRLLVGGTHTQYVVANAGGSLYFQDLTAGRDGAGTRPGDDEIVFADGVGRFDPTGNAEAVARLYGAALGRGADLDGLNYWTHQIDAGTLSLNNVALAFIGSAEFQARFGALSSQGFIAQLYLNVLGRAGDAAGVAFWTGQMNAGASISTLLVDFSDSFEHRQDTQATIGDKDMSEAYRLYQAAFNRAPDQEGLAFWVGTLDVGTSAQQVAQSMAGSAEFGAMFAGLSPTDEIGKLYQNALHRTGDPGGVAYWAGQLQNGVPAGQILLGFADSLENRIATASITHDSWVYTA